MDKPKKRRTPDRVTLPAPYSPPPLVSHNPDLTRGIIQTPEAAPIDRMARYQRNPKCPNCGAHPVICMMRRPGYSLFRCRQCGHKWEVKGL